MKGDDSCRSADRLVTAHTTWYSYLPLDKEKIPYLPSPTVDPTGWVHHTPLVWCTAKSTGQVETIKRSIGDSESFKVQQQLNKTRVSVIFFVRPSLGNRPKDG